MSNSIWKTPDQKPEKENHIVLVGAWATCLWYGGEKPEEIFWENVKRWAYLEDIIAQADKAERLQKAVDLAQERLLSVSDGYDVMKADAETIKRLFYAIQDEASETYKEIKQLIKENQ